MLTADAIAATRNVPKALRLAPPERCSPGLLSRAPLPSNSISSKLLPEAGVVSTSLLARATP